MRIEKPIKRAAGWKVYKMGGRYYVDIGRAITHSYATLEGVAEMLYYNGWIDEKSVKALWRA